MIGAELVTAVLCAPLTAIDLLVTEQLKNVIIFRRLEYEKDIHYINNNGLTRGFEHCTVPMMFVFNNSDAIIIRNSEDLHEVKRRLHLC